MIYLTQEPLIKANSYVYFEGKSFPDAVKHKLFRVRLTQTFSYYLTYFIAPNESVTVELEKVGLYPEQVDTLYELRFSLKGNVLLYVNYPTTTYYYRLEKSGFETDPRDARRRYIGVLTEEDFKDYKLCIYTVKNMDSINLELFNDSFEIEKAVVKVTVNRCKIDECGKDEFERVMGNRDDYIAKNMLRVIVHPREVFEI